MAIEPNIVIDELCNTIAMGLQTKLNDISQTAHGFPLVRTTRDWNDPNVPITDYPILKVYRNSPETFTTKSLRTQVLVSVEYTTLLKRDLRQTPFLVRIGKYIHNYIGSIENVTLDERGYAKGYVSISNNPNTDLIGTYIYTVSVIDTSIPTLLVDVFFPTV